MQPSDLAPVALNWAKYPTGYLYSTSLKPGRLLIRPGDTILVYSQHRIDVVDLHRIEVDSDYFELFTVTPRDSTLVIGLVAVPILLPTRLVEITPIAVTVKTKGIAKLDMARSTRKTTPLVCGLNLIWCSAGLEIITDIEQRMGVHISS